MSFQHLYSHPGWALWGLLLAHEGVLARSQIPLTIVSPTPTHHKLVSLKADVGMDLDKQDGVISVSLCGRAGQKQDQADGKVEL